MRINTNNIRLTNLSFMEQLNGYEQLVPGIKLGKAIKSPLREDNNPSFCIYKSRKSDNIYWKDFGSGVGGDLTELQKLLNKNLTFVKPSKSKLSNTIELDYISRNWEEYDLQLWLKWGIDKPTLDLYNVSAVRSVLLNGYETWRNTITNPIYVYNFDTSYRLYRPLGLKNNKWKTSGSHTAQGLQQLVDSPIKSPLIITKSLKDVMVLHTLGYRSIAPNSETTFFTKDILDKIITKGEVVYLLFDNDKTGIERAKVITDQYPDTIKSIVIPRVTKCKDISDFVAKYSSEEGKLLIKDLLRDS
jgi:hypothetical protein